MTPKDTSSSNFIMSDILDYDREFADLTEIKTEGFNRLVKAKRYGKWFLLKGLKPAYASQSLYKELLRKEFEISMSMEHSNIVHTIGIEEVKSIGYCIIFEYLEGVTLKNYLQSKHPLQEKKRIADEFIAALTYVHEKQIVHRDLKPENIIITTNGHHLKLIDFGLADTDSHAILKQPAGTEKYMAPEQRIEPIADCRNDIYSLGKILIELNPGIIYRHIAHHCLVPIGRRYPNAEAVAKSIAVEKQRLQTLSYAMWSILLVLITLSGVYLFTPVSNGTLDDSLRKTISYGKERIDQINLPLINYIDTLSTFNEHAYTRNQQLIDERNKQLENLVDSLTETCQEPEQSIIVNTLNSYIEQTTPHF